jgi:hypothetical protein
VLIAISSRTSAPIASHRTAMTCPVAMSLAAPSPNALDPRDGAAGQRPDDRVHSLVRHHLEMLDQRPGRRRDDHDGHHEADEDGLGVG